MLELRWSNGGLCVLSWHTADTMESMTIILVIILFVFDVVPVFRKAWKYVSEDVNSNVRHTCDFSHRKNRKNRTKLNKEI